MRVIIEGVEACINKICWHKVGQFSWIIEIGMWHKTLLLGLVPLINIQDSTIDFGLESHVWGCINWVEVDALKEY